MSDNKKDDEALWEAAMRDVRRMPGKSLPEPENKGSATTGTSEKRTESPAIRERLSAPEKPKLRTGKGIDRGTDEKLRRGKMEIEARLDLHGYRQKEAQAELVSALTGWQKQGKRCVLVITGQGKENKEENSSDWWEQKPVLLRKALPGWLAEPPLSEIILQFHQAKQKDGGAGAFYILLRRER